MARLSQAEKELYASQNYKLVYTVAHEFKGSVPFDEIESTALVGFAKALDTFDTQKSEETKAKFATYAVRCMKNEVISFLRKENKRIKNETYAEQAYVQNSDGKEALNIDIVTKEALNERLEDIIIKNEELESILSSLDYLTEQEKYILVYRYGLFGTDIKTQKEIADVLSVSQASISKSQARIEKKLKKLTEKL